MELDSMIIRLLRLVFTDSELSESLGFKVCAYIPYRLVVLVDPGGAGLAGLTVTVGSESATEMY